MTTRHAAALIAMTLAGTGGAPAAERTVTLAVDGMTCASCPYQVRTALQRVPGVARADVSYDDARATVTFDDASAAVADLTAATAVAGFPSKAIDE